MTKAEIVQELLDKGYIDAEKAVVLLTNETRQGGITYIPYQPNPYWIFPAFYPNRRPTSRCYHDRRQRAR